MERARRGTNAVEFAVALPVFLLVLGGIVDCGWLFYEMAALEVAASRGCRDGALVDRGADTGFADVTAVAVDEMLGELEVAGLACDGCAAAASVSGAVPEQTLECGLSNRYDPLFGVMPEQPIVATTARRLEWQR